MPNPYVWKKYGALILCSMLTTMAFFIGVTFYTFMIGILLMFVGMLLSMLIAVLLLKNPFSMMLEGKGILALNLDSTGIIHPFILRVASPYIKGKVFKEEVLDVFDRETVYQLAVPEKGEPVIIKDGKINISIPDVEYNKARFSFLTYPCVLYNAQIKSLLTKDFLSDKEKGAFSEHGVLYLNRKIEELSSLIRDFARHVVESLKPKEGFLQNKWVWIIIVIALIILGIMFAPQILSALGVGGQAAASSVSTISGGAKAVTPIG